MFGVIFQVEVTHSYDSTRSNYTDNKFASSSVILNVWDVWWLQRWKPLHAELRRFSE